MVVTLEVSQLRGWLKASACCRGSQAGHTVWGGLRAGRREAASERVVCTQRAGRGEGERLQIWGGVARGEQRT